MTSDELKNILSCHGMWLNNEKNGKRADLTYANLTGANLTDAIIVAGWKVVRA